MPKKDKPKKDKKKKKSFSTADILKLIKKLKPKNQQIVRVNVGDNLSKKKKPGEVQSSYNPPFVFPSQGFQAITSPGQPPYKPPLIEEPRQASSYNLQPVKQFQTVLPPSSRIRKEISNEPFIFASPTPRISEISESDFSEVEQTSKKGKGYTVRAPRATRSTKSNLNIEFTQEPSLTFNAPKIYNASNLSASAAAPSFFNLPVQNDKYQADIIQIDSSGDQIGIMANSLPSNLWTGSPEGDVTLTIEEIVAPKDITLTEKIVSPEEPAFVAPEEPAIVEEPVPTKSKGKSKSSDSSVDTPVKSESSGFVKSAKASLFMIADVNNAIEKGFKSDKLTKEIVYSKGPLKGFVRKDVKEYILFPVFLEMEKLFKKETVKPFKL